LAVARNAHAQAEKSSQFQSHTLQEPLRQHILAGHWHEAGRDAWRQNYPEKVQAIQAVADLEAEVVGHTEVRRALRTSLNPEELADAESASEQAEGIKISKIVAHYLSLQARAREKGVSLDEGMNFLETRYRAETKGITILNAKTEFLTSRAKVATSTLRNYEGSLQLLLKPDPNKFVHEFTVSDIEKVSQFGGQANNRAIEAPKADRSAGQPAAFSAAYGQTVDAEWDVTALDLVVVPPSCPNPKFPVNARAMHVYMQGRERLLELDQGPHREVSIL
jgi:hypothetical protein